MKRKAPAAGGQTGAGKTKRTTPKPSTPAASESKQAVEFLTRAFAGRTKGFVNLVAFDPEEKGKPEGPSSPPGCPVLITIDAANRGGGARPAALCSGPLRTRENEMDEPDRLFPEADEHDDCVKGTGTQRKAWTDLL